MLVDLVGGAGGELRVVDVGQAGLAHDVVGGAAHVLVVVRPEVVPHLVRERQGGVRDRGLDLIKITPFFVASFRIKKNYIVDGFQF